MTTALPTLVVLYTFNITGRGTAYIVEAPEPPLTGDEHVLVDGIEYVVTGVERKALMPPLPPIYVFDGKQTVILVKVRNMDANSLTEFFEGDLPRIDEAVEVMVSERHPAIQNLMRWFGYKHLPDHLQGASDVFWALAVQMLMGCETDSPELIAGLRKLLEAKDCYVRAIVEQNEKKASETA